MTPPDLDIDRLTLGQPDLDDFDQNAAVRGLVLGLWLAAPLWMLICGLVWLAVWG